MTVYGVERTSLTPDEFRALFMEPKPVPAKEPEEPEGYVLDAHMTRTQVEALVEYLKYHEIHGTLHRVSRETEAE